MAQLRSIVKELSNGHGDRLIRVLAAKQEGGGFHARTYPEGEIQGVAEMGQARSALVLRSGIEIPVALSYEQLERKIYEPEFRNDGPVLDLRDVTTEAAKAKAPASPSPGDKMPDGTVFAGISPDTNKPMYATPADASLTMMFNDAQKYAAQLDAHGHKDWHVPTKAELNVLFNNRAAIGGFNVTGSYPAGWYWSASPNGLWNAWVQRLSEGCQSNFTKDSHSAVRLIR